METETMTSEAETSFQLPPSAPGTYALILALKKRVNLRVGKLGLITFPAGHYVYLGSARGPGGLKGRILRHLRHPDLKKPHWHIDYLSRGAKILHVWWEADSTSRECDWAQWFGDVAGEAFAGFGSSDCTCKSHLVLLNAENHPETYFNDLQLRWKSRLQGSSICDQDQDE
jgi:Uri superfamily endonuclease